MPGRGRQQIAFWPSPRSFDGVGDHCRVRSRAIRRAALIAVPGCSDRSTFGKLRSNKLQARSRACLPTLVS